MLASSQEIERDPARRAVLANADGDVIPDPATYSDWFDRAGLVRRRAAVGARRYAEVRQALGADPRWEHFLDPDTGRLLSARELRAESSQERADRTAKVRALIAERDRLARQAATFGYIST